MKWEEFRLQPSVLPKRVRSASPSLNGSASPVSSGVPRGAAPAHRLNALSIHIDLIKIAIIRQSCILITRPSRPFLGQNEWMFRLSGKYDDRETPTEPLARSAFRALG